jgi:predicted dehydrogenase
MGETQSSHTKEEARQSYIPKLGWEFSPFGIVRPIVKNLNVQAINLPKFETDRVIKIGAIGVGSRLRRLIGLLLHQQGVNYQITAIADESQEALDEAKDMISKFQEFQPQTFTDYRQLLAIGELEWVMIGSKNYLHVSHACDAFAAGKHVFSEKPLAIEVEECARIRTAQKESGKLFATGFVLRHSLLYSEIHRLVTIEKVLGKLVSVEANETLHPAHGGYIMRNWRRFKDQSGPHILEKTCHDLDILQWIIGSVPSRVAAFGGTNIFVPENAPETEKDAEYYKLWPQAWEDVDPFKSEKTIEDNVVAILNYRNGVHCSFHTNACTAWPQRRILICGVKGTLQADLITSQITYQLIGMNQPTNIIDIANGDSHGGGDELIVSDLARSMAEGSQPKATGEEGFISALICLAIDQARTSQQVVDMEPIWRQFSV